MPKVDSGMAVEMFGIEEEIAEYHTRRGYLND